MFDHKLVVKDKFCARRDRISNISPYGEMADRYRKFFLTHLLAPQDYINRKLARRPNIKKTE